MEFLTNKFKREVFEPYRDFLKSEFRFHPKFGHAKKIWQEKLSFDELVNGAFLEKSQNYAAGSSLNEINLHEKTKATIQNRLGNNPLYQHQTEAINLILQGENAVIATGTSSGKTLCYQIPILDDLLKNSSKGLRAIIIYPLNALVNDQLEEWEKMLSEHQEIKFARFTGQTPNTQIDYENRLKEVFERNIKEENPSYSEGQLKRAVQEKLQKEKASSPNNRLDHRDAIRENPPHVLVTNFSMLEYLLERPIDAPIFENANLKYLVLDEVHAYKRSASNRNRFSCAAVERQIRFGKIDLYRNLGNAWRKR